MADLVADALAAANVLFAVTASTCPLCRDHTMMLNPNAFVEALTQ